MFHTSLRTLGRFLGTFVLIFIVSFLILASFGFVPFVADGAQVATLPERKPTGTELPVHIAIPTIGMDVSISNPTSRDVSVLDTALLTGAVRYPLSAQLNEKGTVYLFGHSSYLPIVHNSAYKAFNGIQKLKEGDVITVHSDSFEYTYRVTSVATVDAETTSVDLSKGDSQKLVLSTCDSFGKKSLRFIVEADFVSVRLGSAS